MYMYILFADLMCVCVCVCVCVCACVRACVCVSILYPTHHTTIIIYSHSAHHNYYHDYTCTGQPSESSAVDAGAAADTLPDCRLSGGRRGRLQGGLGGLQGTRERNLGSSEYERRDFLQSHDFLFKLKTLQRERVSVCVVM